MLQHSEKGAYVISEIQGDKNCTNCRLQPKGGCEAGRAEQEDALTGDGAEQRELHRRLALVEAGAEGLGDLDLAALQC